jgi:hypothetical protein
VYASVFASLTGLGRATAVLATLQMRPLGGYPGGRRVVSAVEGLEQLSVLFAIPCHDTDAQNTASLCIAARQ